MDTYRPDPHFWDRSEQVERFASRDPDHRLKALLETYTEPAATRVLDLGCAAGRNTELLATRGFDVVAIDSAEAMVTRARKRLEPITGRAEATHRVQVGRMQDLSRFPDGWFHLVVALGIYHQAASPLIWERAVAETARVLRPRRLGRLIVATFSPASAPDGKPLRPVPGTPHMYYGFRSGPLFLVDEADLERALDARGLVPVTPTETVRVETDSGWRVTVNGLFTRHTE